MKCFILVVKVSAGVWRRSHMLSISFQRVLFYFISLFFFFCTLLHLNCHCCESLWWHLENSTPAWFQVPQGNNLAACAQHERVPGICQAQPALPYGSIVYEQPQRRTKRELNGGKYGGI